MPATNTNYTVLRPAPEAWNALPQRQSKRRQNLVAVSLALLTTVVAFIADRGWETFDEDAFEGAYRAVDMYGLASLTLAIAFSLAGWSIGRLAVPIAPLVLASAAVPHTLDGYASAPLWWAGAALGVLWFLFNVRDSVRQLIQVRSLAQTSQTGETVKITRSTQATIRKIMLKSSLFALGFSVLAALAWIFTYMIFADEQGLTYQELQEESISDFFAAGALAASFLAVALWGGFLWRIFSRTYCGNNLWKIIPGTGPIEMFPSMQQTTDKPGLSATVLTAPGCICVNEFQRSDPDEASDEEWVAEFGIEPSDYCALHGIDLINALDHDQFRLRAASVWFWDEGSGLPARDARDLELGLLLGFSGHGFTGLPVVMEEEGAGVLPGWDELVSERGNDEHIEYGPAPLRPTGGVLDTIDLRPSGYDGHAVRYKHGRAWFEPSTTPFTSPSS